MTFSQISEFVVNELAEIVGAQNIVEVNKKEVNVFDYAPLPSDYKSKFRPSVVVSPSSTGEVSRILELANRKRIPVVARSGVTGFSNGCVAKHGGIQLDMKRMNRILEVNKDRMYVVVQPGLENFAIYRELRKHGFIFPHDPGSGTYSTVGGALATSGAGQLSFRYGALTDQIINIEVVLPSGKIVRFGQGTGNSMVAKASTCYDLKSLFIGTFGTLGIFTEAVVKIYPAPEAEYNGLVAFPKFEDAILAADSVRKLYLPDVDQIMAFDNRSLIVRSITWTAEHENEPAVSPPEIGGGLWYHISGHKEIVEIVKRKIIEACAAMQGEPLSDELAEIFYEMRHLPSYDNTVPRGFDPDYGVPSDARTVIEAKHRQAEIFKKYAIDQILDECWYFELTTMHNTAPYLVDENDHESIAKHAACYTSLCEMALELDGSITGGHGPLFSKFTELSPKFRELMKKECGDVMQLAREIKRIVDPNGIMNPGMMGLE